MKKCKVVASCNCYKLQNSNEYKSNSINIADTKTLDMLKESIHSSRSDIVRRV
ncbi:hypothetical protein X777_04143 [Ooceraea biroi]|uniref:Uncharacterized protein n=1 Tax=Ooceraea biroi TaxID=2015173 RepID=A0A026WIF1_OOCBI|nr:hypothetical protein X777_04143 [Ooceraea biroi]